MADQPELSRARVVLDEAVEVGTQLAVPGRGVRGGVRGRDGFRVGFRVRVRVGFRVRVRG